MKLLNSIPHKPVLLREVLEAFQTEESGIFIDATLGYGGHSSAILKTSPNINLIGIDRDKTAIEFSKDRLSEFGDRVTLLHGKFSEKIEEATNLFPDIPILGILADIGVSSLQLDELDRGFSFESNNLDMRMDRESGLDAEYVVNSYSEFELEKIFKEFGEMRNAKKVARVIVNSRPIRSGVELASILPKKGKGTHPATQLFQAIRIEVNRELEELKEFLNSIQKVSGAKIGVISFHSLEDRIVKEKFREMAKSCICPPESFKCECGDNHEKGYILTKKPIIAKADEVKENPRSRSAKLRLFQTK
jgi:16S rRNA (cytosine1402-N4)-methyltransferase